MYDFKWAAQLELHTTQLFELWSWITDNDPQSALMVSAKSGHDLCLRLLCSRGAKINQSKDDGWQLTVVNELCLRMCQNGQCLSLISRVQPFRLFTCAETCLRRSDHRSPLQENHTLRWQALSSSSICLPSSWH